MSEDSEFRRGQTRAFDAMWDAFFFAQNRLTDDDGQLDPYARAVLAVVRSQLDAMVSVVDAEWACDERVSAIRAALDAALAGQP